MADERPSQKLEKDVERVVERVAGDVDCAVHDVERAVGDVERVAEKAEARVEDVIRNEASGKIGLPLKVFAILSLVVSIGVIVSFALVAIALVTNSSSFSDAFTDEVSGQKLILGVLTLLVVLVQAVLFVVFSVRILRNNRRNAALLTDVMLGVGVLDIVLSMMSTGLVTYQTIYAVLIFIFLTVMHSCLDPALVDERRLQRKLQDMEFRSDAEKGILGRDKTGEGYIELNFFNLFWIFVVACFLGWCFEMAVCPILNGRIEDRTGMLFGPFSPIYGIGATLMTIALNRFYKKNPVIVFAIAGLIGAGFEFFVHWFFQNAFGIMSWDYSGEFLNIQGRTDFFHFVCWGCLGLIFVRWLLPMLLRIVNRIPWNWRYSVTCVCAALMIVNGAMTLLSFDCWFQRVSGHQPDTPVAQFFADNYGNDYMAKHFPTMSIDPNRATHN